METTSNLLPRISNIIYGARRTERSELANTANKFILHEQPSSSTSMLGKHLYMSFFLCTAELSISNDEGFV